MERVLIRLGSRLHVVGEVTALLVLVKSCAAPPAPPPCQGDACETGGGGSGGETATGGSTGGTPDGGAGGAAGGQAGSTSSGGMGGSGGSTGGATGGTGGCEPTFVCGPKDCGMVDDGCGTMLDCDNPDGIGDAVTCKTQQDGETGPMTCGADHVCHCDPPAPEYAQAAADLCQGAKADPNVSAWCASQGGCTTALCGDTSAPKTPGLCVYGGTLKVVPNDPTTWIPVWCCSTANQ